MEASEIKTDRYFFNVDYLPQISNEIKIRKKHLPSETCLGIKGNKDRIPCENPP